jgi:hypothetical protein
MENDEEQATPHGFQFSILNSQFHRSCFPCVHQLLGLFDGRSEHPNYNLRVARESSFAEGAVFAYVG